MANPVIVQGTSPVTTTYQEGGGGSKCKDPLFAILFYINFGAIIGVAATYGQAAFTDAAAGDYEYDGFLRAAAVVIVFSLVLATVSLLICMKFPEFMLKVSLLFTVLLSLVMMALSFYFGSIVGGVIGVIFFAIGVCYAWAVWSRIPFAAANMSTAIAAIKANFGVTLFAYLFPIIGIFWTLIWIVAVTGVEDSTYDDETGQPNYGILFLLFLSFYFTEQVLEACVHTTISGVVGTWWVAPQDNGCCSRAVCNSFIRTLTTSFGSICFGSLLVAIIQALRAIANQARHSEDGAAAIIACLCECILDCLAGILEYFNKWAYVYVGIHGMGYLDSGKEVINLFKNRGWDAIITDDLVGNVVLLTALANGGAMGGVSYALERNTDWFAEAPGDPGLVAFIVGFIVGFAITAILLQTISSGVNAVIVMFAEAPAELARNYPEISQKMISTWNGQYPGSTEPGYTPQVAVAQPANNYN